MKCPQSVTLPSRALSCSPIPNSASSYYSTINQKHEKMRSLAVSTLRPAKNSSWVRVCSSTYVRQITVAAGQRYCKVCCTRSRHSTSHHHMLASIRSANRKSWPLISQIRIAAVLVMKPCSLVSGLPCFFYSKLVGSMSLWNVGHHVPSHMVLHSRIYPIIKVRFVRVKTYVTSNDTSRKTCYRVIFTYVTRLCSGLHHIN